MKDRNQIYLSLSLGICAGLMLINRFVISVPDWLAIILSVLAAIFLITFVIKSRNKNKQK